MKININDYIMPLCPVIAYYINSIVDPKSDFTFIIFLYGGITMKEKKCVVVYEELSEKEILQNRERQKNIAAQNTREGEESAFEKALNGSKLYLRARGFID